MGNVSDVDAVGEGAEYDGLAEVQAALDDAAHAHRAHVGNDAGDDAVVTHDVDHKALCEHIQFRGAEAKGMLLSLS